MIVGTGTGTGFGDEEIIKKIPPQSREIEVTVKMRFALESHETIEGVTRNLKESLDDIFAYEVELFVNGTPFKGTH